MSQINTKQYGCKSVDCGDGKGREMRKSDRSIKLEATKREYRRVYDDMCLPARDIVAECSDGMWRRRAWQGLNQFGWGTWERC